MNTKYQNSIYTILLLASALICFALLIFLRCSNIYQGADYGVDVYYHIKAGDLFPFFATTKTFPWAEMSIWNTNFYDKEMGFHFLIYLFRHIGSLLGFSSEAPFNFISFCFSGLFLLIFSIWGYVKCRKTAFIIAPLLIFISPTFIQKLIIIRPAILSITLFSITIFILISESSFKRKLFYIFIMGWLYTICYSVPHVILIPLFVYFVSKLFSENIKDNIRYILFPCFGLIGIFIGLTLHPQFPNTYLNWYIQGFQVVLKMFGLSSSEVGLGVGMLAPSENVIRQNMLIFILLLINIVLFWAGKKDEKKIFLVLLQFVTGIGFIFSKRFIEYAVPAEIICFVLLVSIETRSTEEHFIVSFYSNIKTLLIGCVLLIMVMLPITNNILKKLIIISPCYEFAEWQKDNLPEKTYVGLLNWGDFPRLFYTAPELTYSMALDPMFSYYVYPERVNFIEQFRLGYNQKLTPAELAEAFGTNLLYAPKYYQAAVMYLLEKGAKVVYYDKEGCLLKLTNTNNQSELKSLF